MKIKEMLTIVAEIVSEREIIDHGSIRCLWSQESVDSILSQEDEEEVETGTIGDDELAIKLREVCDILEEADAGDFADALRDLWHEFSENIEDFIDRDAEDELKSLDKLIDAAQAFVDVF